MEFILIGLIIGTVIVVIGSSVVSTMTKKQNWYALPTVEEYLAKHPNAKTTRGFSCFKCGAGSIRNWGLDHAQSSRRVFMCNHCGEKLYRAEISM